MQTIKIIHSPVSGSTYAYGPMPVELIDRQYTNEEELPTSVIPQTKHKTHNLHRSNEGKTTSCKHKNHKQRTHSGPREEYLACKRETANKHMQPATSGDRRQTKQTLQHWTTTLDSKAIRLLLNMDFPDKLYGYASNINPFDGSFDLELPIGKIPLQYGHQKITQHTHNQGYVSRGRRKKAVMQNFNKTESFLPIDLCYELYGTDEGFCDTPIIDYMNRMDEVRSADAVHVSKEELEQAKKQALQQRFDDCVFYFYPPKAYEKQK